MMKRMRLALHASLALCFASLAGAQVPQPSAFTYYERFIAIDAACGWPNLCLLPDGQIAALIWPHTNHGATEGSAECWVSADEGRSWTRAGVPVPHSPGKNRMNVAAGPFGESLIALVGGWDKRKPYVAGPSSGPYHPEGAVTLSPVPAVSTDGGATWERFPDARFPLRPEGRGLVPYGRIAAIADGTLGVCLYGHGVFFFTSSDGGRSWNRRGTIVSPERTHNETTWVQLENGDLFAAVRTYGEQRLDGFRSTDAGRTWVREGALTMPLQIPGDLLRLPDGRVLLSYGARNRGLYGIWVQLGDAAAKAWSAPMLLVDFEGSTELQQSPVPSSDGGYPSTVVLADGTLVTAYYTRGVPAHQRYHVGVVRWKLRPNGLPILNPAAP
jgi:hypothetical protein